MPFQIPTPGKKHLFQGGLQGRITFSYTVITIGTVLLVEILTITFLASVTEEGRVTTPLFSSALFGSVLFFVTLLFLIPLIGSWFGYLSTRGVIHRLRQLAAALSRIAAGDYTCRLAVHRKDEIGQLERHFNVMATQLTESLSQCRQLAEQNARLAERARIARELHDAVSQDLFSLRMAVGGLHSAVEVGLSTRDKFQLQNLLPYIGTIEETAGHMLHEMRALLLELRPLRLEQQGLGEALEDLANAYRTRLEIAVQTEIQPVSLSPEAEHAILRIAQEAFTNAVRHGEATALTVVLEEREQQVEFQISDNGKGFALEEVRDRHGLGLRLMRERVQELDGSLSLVSVPKQGTRIHIHLPGEKVHD